ncbi:MAG: nicotinate (nicotinamide) nucleotide adenylyltransferase [Candidatus Omnitrophica bacterium]|nr:nicotinate (nicotinamide) nucleotide adenylyltransferase [Candidatus Omnitrophota bacterium]
MNIGVLGGTFNPIHEGHLHLAREACREIPLDRLIWVPTAVSPFKSQEKLLDAEMRYEMVRLAIQGDPRWEISDLELKTDSPSYTVETLEELTKRFPPSEHKLYLIIGSDHLEHFPEWKNASRILKLAEVVAMTRPGFSLRAARGPMRLIPITGVNISSSKIRKELKAGNSIEKLVPAPAAEYIQRKGLYR